MRMKLDITKVTVIETAIITTCIIIGIFFIISRIPNTVNNKCKYTYGIYRDNIELKYLNAKSLIVDEVDKYIKSIAPSSTLNAIVLFELCDKYDIDIKFVLAQGHIESHFGTKGMAKKTNSVFNVFAYDGMSFDHISKQGKYDHPDYSVEPYLILLQKDYLVEGNNEYNLLNDFVNKDGHRYASDSLYEDKLKSKFEYISENTQIDELMLNYNMYKIILNN